jgi:phosphatidylserine/phosphatidylglycerophosphate/cardiolipin synthase-like enzyme
MNTMKIEIFALGVENHMFKRFFALFITLSLLLSGCSADFKSYFVKEKEVPVSDLPAEALLLDGKTSYEKTQQLILSAKKSIYIQQTIFSDDQLMNLVIQKANSGVEVRILLDQFITPNRTTLNELKKQNISVQYYPARKGQTLDSKFLITDMTQAVVYSAPWSTEGFSSYNLSVMLTEKSAWKLAGIFNRDWQFTTTLALDVPKETDLPDDNILLAANSNVKQQLLEHISGSQKSIWVTVSEVTDQDMIQAFVDAANKGRDIRLILSPSIMPGNWPETLNKLESAGIQIRYFKHPENKALSLNLGIFDGESFIMSGSGWSYTSFVMDHELSLTVPSPAATHALIQRFDQDWQNSTQTPSSENNP